MNAADIGRALNRVPAKRLAILELARRCTGEDGAISFELATPLVTEICTATSEARDYAHQTQELKCALGKLTTPR